jgi:hypothetical protein
MMEEIVKIGGIEVTVIREDRDIAGDAGNRGTTSNKKAKIWIDNTMNEQQQNEVIIHEVMEYINMEYDLQLTHTQISVMSMSIHQILENVGNDAITYRKEKKITLSSKIPREFIVSEKELNHDK